MINDDALTLCRAPSQMIGQLFHTLDSDQDGKISFQEFLQGMFQHGRAPGSRSVTPPPHLASPMPPVPPSPLPPTKPLKGSSEHTTGKSASSPGHHRHHPGYRRTRGGQKFKETATADDEMSDKPVSGAVVPIWESGIFSSIDPRQHWVSGGNVFFYPPFHPSYVHAYGHRECIPHDQDIN
ncbi:hypothetical protein HPB48_007147 [Haemaphysalis longicornis]|uniref:EF-hand domain-containing protein n=1 Tax=Haemaphysalis longicornis TaxID=44386 RepID=A0A9J6GMI7_HAELO|nr:hypothetical protein HPB48_007147 [Haemaphysalis longicornis]